MSSEKENNELEKAIKTVKEVPTSPK